MLIAQITDTHVVEPGSRFADRIDSSERLRAAIAHVNAHDPVPDAVIATGDLVNDGRAAQYDELQAVLAELRNDIPLHVVPGNHDDRTELRQRFAELPSGDPGEPIHRVIDDYVAAHAVRIVALDTTVPGAHGGRFGGDDAHWLAETLGAARELDTLIVQHHPPFVTGIAWMDEFGLAGFETEAAVIERHPQVLGVVCGHLHRTIVAPFAGTVASCWPSTAAQVMADLRGDRRFVYLDETPAVTMHLIEGGQLRSHLTIVGDVPAWRPAWTQSAH